MPVMRVFISIDALTALVLTRDLAHHPLPDELLKFAEVVLGHINTPPRHRHQLF